jgi:predicted metal-binding membrane protein
MSARALSARRVARVPAPIVVAIAAAWALVIAAEASGRAAGFHHDALLEGGLSPWLGTALFLVAWQVTVAAMMLPSSLPLIVLFEQAAQHTAGPRRALSALLGGYALAWGAFGAAAFAGDAALHAGVDAWPWLEERQWAIAPGVLALAGEFQFTALKDRCLEQSRHPGAFLIRHYRRGPGGAFTLGLRHGAFCVGCCWALMLVAFALGMASLILMAAMTALMVHEKTRPAGRRGVPVTGAALLGLAAIVLPWSAYTSGAL